MRVRRATLVWILASVSSVWAVRITFEVGQQLTPSTPASVDGERLYPSAAGPRYPR